MQPRAGLLFVLAFACLVSACGGGNSLVPKITPAAPQGNEGPAVARTPFGGTRPAGTPGASGAATAATQATAAPTSPLTYTVVSGDTPNAIAGKLNVPSDRIEAWVTQLLTLNNTTSSGLQIGQELKLPPAASSAPQPAAPGPSSSPGTPRPNLGTPAPGAPVIVQLTSPVGRNQEVTLRVRAASSQGCSPTHLLPNGGVSGADGLGPRLTDSGGNVTWTFVIPGNTPVGEGVIRIICAGNVVAAPLVVN